MATSAEADASARLATLALAPPIAEPTHTAATHAQASMPTVATRATAPALNAAAQEGAAQAVSMRASVPTLGTAAQVTTTRATAQAPGAATPAAAAPAAAPTRGASVGTNPTAARKRRPRKPKVTCEDCFFHQNMLCALDTKEPCPTFRHHEQGLTPPQQLSFVFRQERTRAAWVFERRDG